MKNSQSSFISHRYVRLLVVAVAIVSCLFVVRAAALFGFSRLLVTYSLASGNLAAAKKAIELTPKDAEAHLAGAAVMSSSGTPDQALVELQHAVALRPEDYELWNELGLLCDQTGDSAAAVAAFDEAVRRAPFYSQPRWNRGNVLLRKGQYDAAFIDLNQAAQSNQELIPNLVDLAWGISKGDVKSTEQLARIDTGKRRIAFARFLARRGKGQEAIEALQNAGPIPGGIQREMVELLLAKGAYKEGFDIWRLDRGLGTAESAGRAILDGGFEGSLAFGESGFGWRVPRDLQATSIFLDSSQPHSGSKDLRIEFGGNSNPGSILVSQLVLAEPSRRYKINFASRSQDIVTGGLPLLFVSDAAGEQKRLGQSAPLAKGTSDWQVASFEFTSGDKTTAVILNLARENCSTSPCPIFGSIALDSFSLEEIK